MATKSRKEKKMVEPTKNTKDTKSKEIAKISDHDLPEDSFRRN